MQGPLCSVNGEIDIRVPAHAKNYLLDTRLMHRTIANDPCFSIEQVLVQRNDFAEMWRACLLFTLKDELNICRGNEAIRFERLSRRDYRHHTGFIIRSRAGIQ